MLSACRTHWCICTDIGTSCGYFPLHHSRSCFYEWDEMCLLVGTNWMFQNILPSLGFHFRSFHVGFVVEKVALGQVFWEYYCIPTSVSFHQHYCIPASVSFHQYYCIPTSVSFHQYYFIPTSVIIPPVLLYSQVSIIPPVLQTHILLHAVFIRTTNWSSTITFHKAMPFRKSESIG